MSQRQTFTLILIICLVLGAAFFVSQKKQHPSPPPVVTPPPPPSLPSTSPPEPVVPTEPSSYHSLKLESTNPIAELTEAVGKERVPMILALNRIDAGHIAVGATLVIPADSVTDIMTLSPFPVTLPSAVDIPKILFISQINQAFAAYEHGTLVRWGAVSTGKKSTPTPSKLFYTNWKGELETSTVNDEWIMPWYFNLENFGGVSIHQYDLPGYPASHSCVRLSESDAIWFYNWAEQWILSKDGSEKIANGTPVIVFGEYAYGNPAPWKNLPTDPNATTVTTDDLESILGPYLSDIQDSIDTRTAILNSTQ